ncbi:uncharacterized protein LOC123317884 [Coccinella septempunctata]|uniref:uncharacterized protein LOC123317884 n=1 Tax=Coccinella septempunctata TaxID=41139 RepID=UPI001D06BA64|nr:uncharacterized protein LOC123317884 [Coccinella septempunctata]
MNSLIDVNMQMSAEAASDPKLGGQQEKNIKLMSTNFSDNVSAQTEFDDKTSTKTVGTEFGDERNSSNKSAKRTSISISLAPKLLVENDNDISEFVKAYRGSIMRQSVRASILSKRSNVSRSSKAGQYNERKSVTYEAKLVKLGPRDETIRKSSEVSFGKKSLEEDNLASRRSSRYQHEDQITKNKKRSSAVLEFPEHHSDHQFADILRQSLRSSLMPDIVGRYNERKSVTYETFNERRRKSSQVLYGKKSLEDTNLPSRKSLGHQDDILRQSLRSSLIPDKVGRYNERKSVTYETFNERRRKSSQVLFGKKSLEDTNLPLRKSLGHQDDIPSTMIELPTDDLKNHLSEHQIVDILRQSLRKSLIPENIDGYGGSKVGRKSVEQSQSSASSIESVSDASTTHQKSSEGQKTYIEMLGASEIGTYGRLSIAEFNNFEEAEDFEEIHSQSEKYASTDNIDKEVSFKMEPREEIQEIVLLHGAVKNLGGSISSKSKKSSIYSKDDNDSTSDETSEDSGISISDNSDAYGGRFDFTYKYKGYTDIQCLRTNFGHLKWLSMGSREYCGYFQYNNLHGEGYYFIKKEGCLNFYEGKFYNNKLHGYGQIIYNNGDKFEGLFSENIRFGPGVRTHGDGSQDVGMWLGNWILRLSTCSSDIIPLLGKSTPAKLKLLEYKKIIPVTPAKENIAESILKDLDADETTRKRFKELYNPHVRNAHSIFFDKSQYDFSYFGSEDCNIDVMDDNAALLDFVWSKQKFLDERPTIKVKHTKEMEKALRRLKKKIENLKAQWGKNNELEEFGEEMPNHILNNENDGNSSSCEVSFLKNVLQFLEFKLNRCVNEKKPLRNTTKIVVDSILSWNNDQTLVDLLRHCFLCRKSEGNVSFNAKNVIIGHRTNFNQPGRHEKNCSNFLDVCASSDVTSALQLLANENINPNLRDSRGNTGLHLATWRNDTNIIRTLANHGVNLDCVNDEGVTPLNLCLLQHLESVYDVTSWDVSFLDLSGFTRGEHLSSLRPNAAILSLLQANLSEATMFRRSSTKFGKGRRFSSKQKASRTSCQTLATSSKASILPGRFIFSLQYTPSSGRFATVSEKDEESVAGKSSSNSKECARDPRRLTQETQILATLKTLLHYGADPNNKDGVPYSPLFLALFTRSPQILESFLSGKADPNLKLQGMTPIQVVSCLEPSEENCELMRMLIDRKADPNILSDPDIWKECDEHLLGDYEPVNEVQKRGKNALHFICLREDFTSANDNFLCKMAEMLILANVDTQSLYLGHSHLSMAVTKGNLGLVEVLVRFVDAGRPLGFGLGNSLTILALPRYHNILPPFFVCQKIMDILLTKISPFDPLYCHRNIFEFLDSHSSSNTQDNPQEWNKYASYIKSIQVFLSTDPTKESGKSSQELSRVYLQEESRKILDVINKFKAVFYLYCFIKEGPPNKYTNHLAKFLISSDESLRYIKYIFNEDKMSHSRFSPLLIAELMTYVDGVNKVKKTIEIKQEEMNNASRKIDEMSLASKKSQRVVKPRIRGYNIDDYLKDLEDSKFEEDDVDVEQIRRWVTEENVKKCDVCYFCMQREDKVLLKCPNCGIVKFCSKRCNFLSLQLNSCHRCPGIFYQDIHKKYKELINKNQPVPIYGIDLAFNTLIDEKVHTETPVTPKIIPGKKGNITLDIHTSKHLKIRLRSGEDSTNKERFSPSISNTVKQHYTCRMNKEETKYLANNSSQKMIDLDVLKSNSYLELDEQESEVRKEGSFILQFPRMEKKEKGSRRKPIGRKSRRACEMVAFPSIHDEISKGTCEKQSKNEINFFVERGCIKGKCESLKTADEKFALQAYRYFLRNVSDLDVESLFLPFTCYSKGKLFHRLPSDSFSFYQSFFS